MMDLLEVALPTADASPSSPESTIVLTTASSDGCINLYDLSALSGAGPSAKGAKGKGKGKGKAKAAAETSEAAKETLQVKPVATFDTDKSRLTSICAIGLVEKRPGQKAQGAEEDEDDASSSEEEEEEEGDGEDDDEEDGMLDKFAGEESGDENEEFEGVMINLSDNEIEDDSQDEGKDPLEGLEDLEDDEDDDEEEFAGIEDVE